MGRKPGATYGSHPLVRYVRSLEGEYYLIREVAEMLGCSMRRLEWLRGHTDPPLGATHRAQYGGTVVHLYTPERIEAISEYLKQAAAKATQKHHGSLSLWTTTERHQRERDLGRAYRYRARAAAYTAKGKTEEAAQQTEKSVTMLANLEKARLKRWAKVHGEPWKPPTPANK